MNKSIQIKKLEIFDKKNSFILFFVFYFDFLVFIIFIFIDFINFYFY